MVNQPFPDGVGLPAGGSARGANGRFHIDVHGGVTGSRDLADDVRRGLLLPQKTLPSKYFYDDRGARLFDAICDLPEYYLTRVSLALLEQVAGEIVALTQPRDLVEFGSGASRKTRVLLDAFNGTGHGLRYIPIDVSEGMLRRSALALLDTYPQLRIHAVLGDYERDLERIPPGRQRLVLFLGSTIGNFTRAATAQFLTTLRHQLAVGDYFLLGVDLVKPVEVLEAAYNDGAGVTAEFNRNILRVINRALDGDFDPERFEHVAFFNVAESQIEMHLRAREAHAASLRELDLTVAFAEGETIHTEISRKFTRGEVESMLAAAGFEPIRWYTPANDYFALAVGRAA